MIQKVKTIQKKKNCQLTTTDIVNNDDTNKSDIKKSGKICPKLRNSKCQFGFRGEKCPDFFFQKSVKKFLRNGKFFRSKHLAGSKGTAKDITGNFAENTVTKLLLQTIQCLVSQKQKTKIDFLA